MPHLSYPNESATYRDARNKLLDAEIALRAQIEAVAAQRRALPPGGEVPQDYVFERVGANAMPDPAKWGSFAICRGKPTIEACNTNRQRTTQATLARVENLGHI